VCNINNTRIIIIRLLARAKRKLRRKTCFGLAPTFFTPEQRYLLLSVSKKLYSNPKDEPIKMDRSGLLGIVMILF